MNGTAAGGLADGRRVLLVGGARSGKSVVAEGLLADRPDVVYAATGGTRDGDAEWAERVALHRGRRPAGWTTAETLDLEPLLRAGADAPPLLVDCVSLWLTGVMDEVGAWDDATWAAGGEEALRERVAGLVAAWRESGRTVVAVSNEVGSGVVPATAAGRRFRDELGRVNAALGAGADEVLYVVAGTPLPLRALSHYGSSSGGGGGSPAQFPAPLEGAGGSATPSGAGGRGFGAAGGGGTGAADDRDRAAEPVRLADALRFAFGTLTAVPVALHRWDRRAARAGIALAPLAGAALGLAAGALGAAVSAAGGGGLLAAVAAVGALAALTRALHLDGLADTADGLGSAKPAARALEIMKASDIGPFGVVTLLLVTLGQIAAAARVFDTAGWLAGGTAVAVAATAGRLALAHGCRTGVPAARPGGLGAAVAGTVPRWAAAVSTAAVTLAGAAALYAADGPAGALRGAAGVLAGTAAAALVLRHTVRRFGGITGDVLGCLVETAATAALVAAALGR